MNFTINITADNVHLYTDGEARHIAEKAKQFLLDAIHDANPNCPVSPEVYCEVEVEDAS